MIGQHAPRLEAHRPPVVHPGVWIAAMGIVVLAIVVALAVLIGTNLWGSGVDVPTGQELRETLANLRSTMGGGGFI